MCCKILKLHSSYSCITLCGDHLKIVSGSDIEKITPSIRAVAEFDVASTISVLFIPIIDLVLRLCGLAKYL